MKQPESGPPSAVGPYAGKDTGKLALLRDPHGTFSARDVVLADALYCNYWLIATMLAAEVDIVMQQHGARHTDFRRGKSLGKCDHIVSWSKPAHRPNWMTRQQYQAFPEQLMLRESKRQHRIVVTSLLDAREVSQEQLSQLYAKRWNVEFDLRNIKTSMGMDVLDCHSLEMNIKQLWVHLLAYNVIRLLMAQAARHAAVDPLLAELQTHRAAMQRMECQGFVSHGKPQRTVRAHRAAYGGQSPWPPGASHAKATT